LRRPEPHGNHAGATAGPAALQPPPIVEPMRDVDTSAPATPAPEPSPAATGGWRGLTPLRHVGRAFQHRNYRLYFAGQLLSLMGTWIQTVAQS
jgi:hypothetical protein